MNRKIKFRLIKDGEIVGHELHRLTQDDFSEIRITHLYQDGLAVDITRFPEDKIEHDSKVQFTGLEDKNGQEICEGDIIKGEYAGLTEEEGEYILAKFKGVVEFAICGFDVRFFNKEERFGKEAVDDPHKLTEDATALNLVEPELTEILGNKFDDPELLPEDCEESR